MLRLLWAFFQSLPDRKDSSYWPRCYISGCPSCCGFSVMTRCRRHPSSLTGHLLCEASLLSITNTSPLCLPTTQSPQSTWVCFSLESSLWAGIICPIHVCITLPVTTPPRHTHTSHRHVDGWSGQYGEYWWVRWMSGYMEMGDGWITDLEGWTMEWQYWCGAWIINNRWMKSFEWICGLDRGMIRQMSKWMDGWID